MNNLDTMVRCALRAWERSEFPDRIDETNMRNSLLAAFRGFADPPKWLNEVVGTYACPICGYDKPHGHEENVIAAYRADQIRNDGWFSVVVNQPKSSGLYLVRGHHLKRPKNDPFNISYLEYQRRGESRGYLAEVVHYDHILHRFYLLHFAGNAQHDGHEGRHAVYISPTQWREIPPFNTTELAASDDGDNEGEGRG